MSLTIRDAAPQDAAALIPLNDGAAPGVPAIGEAALTDLIDQSARSLIAAEGEALLGFMIALPPGLAYDSPNYQWFVRRGGPFLYIDRIAVAPKARGRGVGEALYAALIEGAPAQTPLACEVNLAPPNPGSLRFHQRLGFREIGRAAHEPGVKEVAFLTRAPIP